MIGKYPIQFIGGEMKKKEIIVGLLKASFSEKAMKYSQMQTGFSTGSTAQHPECHAYKTVTEKLLHMVNLRML